MTVDHAKLRELAEAATPGPWEVDEAPAWPNPAGAERHRGILEDTRRADCDHVILPGRSYLADRDARFIAAANPAAVLELLGELAAAVESADGWRREFEAQAAARREDDGGYPGRIVDIVSEAFGLQPVMPRAELLTVLERGLFYAGERAPKRAARRVRQARKRRRGWA